MTSSTSSIAQVRQRKKKAVTLRGKQALAKEKQKSGDTAKTHCAPASVHTHARQPSRPMATFEEMLQRTPVLVPSNTHDLAYAMADYCLHTRRMMETVIRTLEQVGAGVDAPMAQLTQRERDTLKQRRAKWNDHLRANFYNLIGPPPSSGGATARYSLAVQLWILIAHANVILQQSEAVSTLFTFYPPNSAYLSRNALVVDNGPVMSYPMRTVIMAAEKFVCSLDTLDRFSADYASYMTALEHRISELICHTGRPDEYNAPDWCVKVDGGGGGERASDEFIQHSMCWMNTLYNYHENWIHLGVVGVWDGVLRRLEPHQVRVPAHLVDAAPWLPSTRSMNMLVAFVCDYTYQMKDDVFKRGLRQFLMQFELRPHDSDLYRVLFKTNTAHIRSVLQHDFRGFSSVARAYIRKVHYERSVYPYICEALQWQIGDPEFTRSGALDRLQFFRELAAVFAMHQFIHAKFHTLDWKARFMLFHRDPQFITALNRARTYRYPVIVQEFGRFGVFAPHQRNPQLDADAVLHWRAVARAKRLHLAVPAPPSETPPPAGRLTAEALQHARVYECRTFLQAFAVWALWLLQLTGGKVDDDVNLHDFLVELFGW